MDQSSGRCTYVIGNAVSETPLPPSPPTIIDYLSYDDFETPQKIWSEENQMFLYSTHRKPILKPQAMRVPVHPALLFGNMTQGAELPRLKVVVPKTGSLASCRDEVNRGTSSFTFLRNVQTAFEGSRPQDPCLHTSDDQHLSSSTSVGSTWLQTPLSNKPTWCGDEQYQNRSLENPGYSMFHLAQSGYEGRLR